VRGARTHTCISPPATDRGIGHGEVSGAPSPPANGAPPPDEAPKLNQMLFAWPSFGATSPTRQHGATPRLSRPPCSDAVNGHRPVPHTHRYTSAPAAAGDELRATRGCSSRVCQRLVATLSAQRSMLDARLTGSAYGNSRRVRGSTRSSRNGLDLEETERRRRDPRVVAAPTLHAAAAGIRRRGHGGVAMAFPRRRLRTGHRSAVRVHDTDG